MCRHCPIPAAYDGRFFVVGKDAVLADIDAQVAAGARHITFGDPDFLNGPGHTLSVVRAMHARHPQITFDITTKVEHVLEHAELFDELAELGCLFVISAVESLNDTVLHHLAKGHTRADVERALEIVEGAGIAFRPSLMPFTPWETLEGYVELCRWIFDHGLIDRIDPIQLAIRLLLPPGSLLARSEAIQPHLGPLEPDQLSYRWQHPDPRMDRLQQRVQDLVEQADASGECPERTFARIYEAAHQAAGLSAPRPVVEVHRKPAPRMTETWFCCAEPTQKQRQTVG
jgi:hypothetical protein